VANEAYDVFVSYSRADASDIDSVLRSKGLELTSERSRLVTSSNDKTARLWVVATGKSMGELPTGHAEEANRPNLRDRGNWQLLMD
jgi:hypothetical protein